MKIILATGIYSPDIGGIATYAEKVGEALRSMGHRVMVVTYGGVKSGKWKVESGKRQQYGTELRSQKSEVSGSVIMVSKNGGVLSRWRRYAKALREHASDADVVVALSSVSVGVPLMFAGLKKPKKILRLGGEFFWERYTDAGGMLGLATWHKKRFGFWRFINALFMGSILRSFDAIIYSTEFQQSIHERFYKKLPTHRVIENAVPAPSPQLHGRHQPFRVLSMSRHVGFKNLFSLVDAMSLLPDMHCTFVGSGPLEGRLRAQAGLLGLSSRAEFHAPVSGTEKDRMFAECDLLVIPSTTEISPNTALEARAAGLPVLLTRETGLSERLTKGMVIADLLTPQAIAKAVTDIASRYDSVARDAASTPITRDWSDIATEWQHFLHTIV